MCFFEDQVEDFCGQLDFADFSYTSCCIQLDHLLNYYHKLGVMITPDMKENVIQFISFLCLNIEGNSTRHQLLRSLHEIPVCSSNCRNVSEVQALFTLYYVVMTTHSFKKRYIKKISNQCANDHDFVDLQMDLQALLKTDYQIINQLLKKPSNRNYDVISLVWYERSLDFFDSAIENIVDVFDFQQLCKYLDMRSFQERLDFYKDKIFSIFHGKH